MPSAHPLTSDALWLQPFFLVEPKSSPWLQEHRDDRDLRYLTSAGSDSIRKRICAEIARYPLNLYVTQEQEGS